MSKIYNRYPWIFIIVIVVMTFSSIFLIYINSVRAQNLVIKEATLVDASMEAKYEITLAHLWFEEYISGDTTVTKEIIREHILESKWYLNAMLEGGKNSEGMFYPVDKKYTEVRSNITKAFTLLEMLHVKSHQRLEDIKKSGIGSKADQQYDLDFQTLIKTIDDIETDIQNIIKQDLQEFIYFRNFLIAFVVFVSILVMFSYRYILRYEKSWLLGYYKIKDQKEDLERSQKIIDAYVPISMTDTAGLITYVNDAMCRLSGYTRQELIGKNHRILKMKGEDPQKYKELWQTITQGTPWSNEIKNIDKYGKIFWALVQISPFFDDEGNILGYQAVREDITAQKELEYIAQHDNLTQLYNRMAFEKSLQKLCYEFDRYKHPFSLLLLDIDHFKRINDTYGHQIGDSVLQELAGVLSESTRKTDTVARWGGEEFVIILLYTSQHQALEIAEKIRSNVQNKQFTGVEQVTISLGLTEVKEGDSPSSLIKRADEALYSAKASGRNKVLVY